MIRRRSSLNYTTLNLNFINEFCFFWKVYQVEIFRSSVNLKRFNTGVSKFKRRTISRWKRRSNWLPYLLILKNWAYDYSFFRKYYNYQFRLNLLPYNYYIFDFNQNRAFIARSLTQLPPFLVSPLPQSLFFSIQQRYSTIDKQILNTRLFSLTHHQPLNPAILVNSSIIYLNFENNFYHLSKAALTGDLNLLDSLFLIFFINYVKEVYKIITLFFFIKLI